MNTKIRSLSKILPQYNLINLKNLKMKKSRTVKIQSSLYLKAGVKREESLVWTPMLISLAFSAKRTVLSILELSQRGIFTIEKQSSPCLPPSSSHPKPSKSKMPLCLVQCLSMALICFVKINVTILNNFVWHCSWWNSTVWEWDLAIIPTYSVCLQSKNAPSSATGLKKSSKKLKMKNCSKLRSNSNSKSTCSMKILDTLFWKTRNIFPPKC